ncbi:PLAT/LH2 domain, partial [Trinorchestia longiramus]
KVSFLITGDWDDSDVRTLQDDNRRILYTGAQDHFVLTVPRCLGQLRYLRIWHDNSGRGNSASWLFSHMVVRDLQANVEYQFICNEWLAVEEGDGMIDRVVPVAGLEQMQDTAHVIGKKVQRAIQDDHLWFSVFLRPPRSRFTRVQRLSACMALVYLSMLTNAMFYNVVPESASSINMGFARIAPAALGVGFISNLIVFPPSFAIVYFFRKARPRGHKPSRVKEALTKTEQKNHDYLVTMMNMARSKKSINYADIKEADLKISDWTKKNADVRHRKLAFMESSEKTATQDELEKQAKKDKRKLRSSLPWYFRYIAWALCVVCIVVSVFFLWAYGIMF